MNADITMPDNSINATFKLEIVPDISDLATKAEVAAVEAQIPDVSGFATKTELSAVEAEIPTVPTNVSSFTNDSNYVTDSILQQNLLLSNSLITGNVSSNAVVYSDIMSRLHSTFDSTKFTVTGSPTITDNGIASGFSTVNCVKIANPSFNLGNADIWRVEFAFETGNSWQTYGERLYQWEYTVNKGLVPYISGTGTFVMPIHDQNGNAILASADFSNNQLSVNTKYYGYCEFTGTSYTVKIGTNRDNLTTICQKTVSTKINNGINVCFIGSKLDQSSFSGKIDLKNVVVTADGVTVFTGNMTGSDSYTVNGSTVTIPYEVTSGGAKIANSAYRTAIQSVYAENGYAPYYTIDEANQNFTLPMGDLYGMLQKLSDRITALET